MLDIKVKAYEFRILTAVLLLYANLLIDFTVNYPLVIFSEVDWAVQFSIKLKIPKK